MYTSNEYELAKARQRDFLAAGARERRAREALQSAPAAQPSATRRSRRVRLVPRLHPQAQS